MDFTLSAEELELKAMARDLATKRIAPLALEMDEHQTIPKDLIKEVAELGYFGCTIPEAYGGMGLTTSQFMGLLEELCYASAGFGIMVSVHNTLAGDAFKFFASEELKKKYLPKMATGEMIGAYCLTEPHSGTDAGALITTAVDKGDHYVVSGLKSYVTNGGYADLFVVFAKTHPEEGSKGISLFAIEANSPGITLGKPEQKCGIKCSDTREISFQDVKVPKENLIGPLKNGFKQAMHILNGGRIGVAFQACGIAQAALDEAIKYAKARKQFGQPIANFQAIQFKISEMGTRLDAGRLLGYRAAFLKDNNQPYHREASMAKLFCSRMSGYVTDEAVQIHGGYGYIKEYPVERYFRDARITELYEGTTEAQRMVISRDLLKD